MSNRIVPNIYRIIIDDVVQSVRSDFDEFGVEEDMLALLQQKWESKLLESHVADFEPTSPPPIHPQHIPVPFPLPASISAYQQPYIPPPPGSSSSSSGRTLGFGQGWSGGLRGGGEIHGAMRLRGGENDSDNDYDERTSSSNSSAGDEGSDIEEGSKSTVTGSTPLSIPPPVTVASVPYEANAKGIFPGDEEINSDLDDSDDEADDDGQEADGGGTVDGMDIVFCVYDKVQRVKNKWKMVFKDGMAHVNGRDYLFSKASSDFEW